MPEVAPAQVTVVGVDGPEFAAAARAALAGATVVVGSRQHLDWAANMIRPVAQAVELGPLRAGLAAVAERKGPAVVLASGDPGWYGIVRSLTALPGLTADQLRVLPAPSSISRLAAALGQPWDQVVTCSAHGRDPRVAVNTARALPAVAILTGPDFTVRDLAAALEGWPRTLSVGQRLGYPDEQVITCDAAAARDRTWATPNLVLVTDPTRSPQVTLTGSAVTGSAVTGSAIAGSAIAGGWGLPESEYQHRNGMITKAEVRAWAVGQLCPGIGRLIWDLGAGSGSVGIECARNGSAVISVEAEPGSVERIRDNAQRHLVSVRAVSGRAPQALDGLPEPDAVFVGGGGPEVVAAVVSRRVPRLVVACAVLDHALNSRDLLRSAGYHVSGVQLAASRLVELPSGGVRLAAVNPTLVLTANLVNPGETP